MMRVVALAELECATQHADCVVEGLLAAPIRIGHARERHVVDAQEGEGSDPRPPEGIEHAPVARHRGPRKIITPESRLAVRDELIEDLVAGPHLRRIDHPPEELVFGQFLIEEDGQ